MRSGTLTVDIPALQIIAFWVLKYWVGCARSPVCLVVGALALLFVLTVLFDWDAIHEVMSPLSSTLATSWALQGAAVLYRFPSVSKCAPRSTIH